MLALAPLLPVVLVAALYRAGWLRDPSVLAPAALLGAVLVFEALAYSAGSLFGFLRYQIAVVPLFFVLIGSLLATSHAAVRPASPRRAHLARVAATGRVLPVVLAVAVGLPGMASSGVAVASSYTLASQEWAHVRPAVSALLGKPPLNDGSSDNGAFSVDRDVAAYLDEMGLPDGSVVVDSGAGFAVVVASQHARQFVITSDRDFTAAVADPVGGGVRYLLLSRDTAQFDELRASWPDLADRSWATLERSFVAASASGEDSGASGWDLWRVGPPA